MIVALARRTLLAGAVLANTGTAATASVESPTCHVPAVFVQNMGQFDEEVLFLANDGPVSIICVRGAFIIQTRSLVAYLESSETETVTSQVAGSSLRHVRGINVRYGLGVTGAQARPCGENAIRGRFNYFIGNEPSRWVTNAPAYHSVRYPDVAPGVDAILALNDGVLTVSFAAEQSSDLLQVGLSCNVGDAIAWNDRSEVDLTDAAALLVAATDSSELLPQGGSPTGWLARARSRFPCAPHPEEAGSGGSVSLDYSTYLGGSGFDEARGIAVLGSGIGAEAIICGRTASATMFPRFPGPFDASFNGAEDAFVAKFTSAGEQFVYASYIGGSNVDVGFDVAVSESGEVYVTGTTLSADFPVTVPAYDSTFNGGITDAFVLKLNAAGSGLVYSTYLGGAGGDTAYALDIDSRGAVHVTGQTASADYPLSQGAFNTVFNAGSGTGLADIFVTKVAPDGLSLVYSTYIAGDQADAGLDIALDESGGAHIAAQTNSAFIPVSAGALDPTKGGADDGYTASLNATGTALLHGTYLATTENDSAHGIDVSADGSTIWVAGYTASPNFPTTAGAFDTTHNGSNDGFVLKMEIPQSTLSYSTFLGGTRGDVAWCIDVDAAGSAYVGGGSFSTDFPITVGAFDPVAHRLEGFLSKLDVTGGRLAASTYVGGSGADQIYRLTLNPGADVALAVGYTLSPDFPVTLLALDQTYSGGTDAFLARVGMP